MPKPTVFLKYLVAGVTFAISMSQALAEDAVKPVAPKGVVIELEDGTFDEGEAADEHFGFTGTGFANFFRTVGAYVEVAATVKTAGNYNMVIRYANGSFEDRPMQILVNGKVVAKKQNFTGTSDEVWDLYKTLTIENVPFKAGKNTLKFVCIDEDGPNLDNVTLVKTPEGTPEKK